MNLFKQISIDKELSIKLQSDVSKMENTLKQQKIQYTLKQISGSYHLRSLKFGFEIQYTKNNIQTFFAYFKTKKFQSFKGSLPHNINQKWTLRTAVLYFGEPKVKSSRLVEIIYQNLGIGLVFQGHWSHDESLIDYCYFFESSQQKICSNCKANVQKLQWICFCKGVGYCSKECKNKHIGLHNITCTNIQE